jgi:hypothetical protein
MNLMGTYKGAMLHLNSKKPKNPKKEGCLKLTIMQTICKRMQHTWYLHKYLMNRKIFMISACIITLYLCWNPNIGFVIKCAMQGPMRPRMCLGVKHILTNGGECKGWSPMNPQCTPTLGGALVQELWMFKALVIKAKKHQIGPPRYN